MQLPAASCRVTKLIDFRFITQRNDPVARLQGIIKLNIPFDINMWIVLEMLVTYI